MEGIVTTPLIILTTQNAINVVRNSPPNDVFDLFLASRINSMSYVEHNKR